MRRRIASIFISLMLLALPLRPALGAAYYITGPGETPESVAHATMSDPELLRGANGLAAGEALAPGLLLRLPTQPLARVDVRPGDTLSSLARAYDTDTATLRALNSVGRWDRIYAGSSLLVPIPEEQSALLTQVSDTGLLLASRGGVGWLSPACGVISSRFGPRGAGFHYGLDIAADQGAEIMASRGGAVAEAGWKSDAYGWTVVIDHGEGQVSLYAHCSELLVSAGDMARQGDIIALMGSSGRSTGPHVHFEIRINGECRDPLDYLK